MRYLFIILLLYCLPVVLPAQSRMPQGALKKRDSLLAVLGSTKPDTISIRTLYELTLSLNKDEYDGRICDYSSQFLSHSPQQQHQWSIAASYYINGFCEFAKRNYEKALDQISQAEQGFKIKGDKKSAGQCAYLRAGVFYDMGNYPGTIDNYTAALATWQEIGYNDLAGECNNELARSSARLGNYSKAIEYAFKGLKLSEAMGNKATMGQSLHLIGAYYYRFGDHENAMKNFREATAIYHSLGNRFDFARNNNMIGEILLDQGQASLAREHFSQSLKIYMEPAAPGWGVPWGYSNLGSVFEKQGDSASAVANKAVAISYYKEALNNYLASLKGFEAIQDPAGTAEQTIFIGKIYFKLGEIATAKKYLLEGLKRSGKFGERQNLTPCYLYLSQIDSAEGNVQEAYRHYKTYVQLRDSMFNRQSFERLSIYKAQHEFEKKEQELKLLTAENELQSALVDKQNQRRKFAWIIAGLIFIVSIIGFYRYRRYTKIKAEQKLLKERFAISQDLHDHVGSTLSSISVFSKVAQLQGEENRKEEMNELLGRIRSTSNTMITDMNDIVWAINPVNDSMEKIIQRMEAYAMPLLEARNTGFQFAYDKKLFQLTMEMEKRKNLYLIFKEAVNNAAKYSAASMVKVSLEEKAGQLFLEISDDGIGFVMDEKANNSSLAGNGLRNMQARAEAIGGRIQIDSAPGKGTRIGLRCTV